MEAVAPRRVVAFVIDLLLVMLVGVVTGHQIADMSTARLGFPMSLVGGTYLLFRDIGGASPGKLVVGLRVRNEAGAAAPVAARILRNVTLALGPILATVIPAGGLGNVVRGLGSLVLIIDLVFYHSGRRMGDRLAGTSVLRRSAG